MPGGIGPWFLLVSIEIAHQASELQRVVVVKWSTRWLPILTFSEILSDSFFAQGANLGSFDFRLFYLSIAAP